LQQRQSCEVGVLAPASECGGASSLPFRARCNCHHEEMIDSIQSTSLLPPSPSHSVLIGASAAHRAHAAADSSGRHCNICPFSAACILYVCMCVCVCVCVCVCLCAWVRACIKQTLYTQGLTYQVPAITRHFWHQYMRVWRAHKYNLCMCMYVCVFVHVCVCMCVCVCVQERERQRKLQLKETCMKICISLPANLLMCECQYLLTYSTCHGDTM